MVKVATDRETRQLLWEQEKIKEMLATEGARILSVRLRSVARGTLRKEMKADPFTQPEEILKARQLRYVLKTLLPHIIDGLVNYDPDAPDKQVAPEDKFSLVEWIKGLMPGKA